MEPPLSPKTPQNEDNSKKSLNMLIDSLNKLPKKANVDTRSPKATTSKTPKTAPTRKRGLKCDDKHPKITQWLTKENQSSKKPKSVELNSRLKPLDITKSSEKVVEKDKKRKTLKRSPSFDKYGIVLPSFEKIVSDQEKFEKHRTALQKLDALDESLGNKTVVPDCLEEMEEFTEELLDCKHLSFQDLSRAFNKHLNTLVAIKNGEKNSKRHNRFHENTTHVTPSNDLRCSASLIVFTQEQKEHLLDLLREELDPDERCTAYFFKVLLPELCLRIFKDEHQMTKKKATDYLDRRPVDI